MSKFELPDPYGVPDDKGGWDHCIEAGEQIEDVLMKVVTFAFHEPVNADRVLEWLTKRLVSYETLVKLGAFEEEE